MGRPRLCVWLLGGDGLPVFERLRGRRQDRDVFLFAFDLRPCASMP
jgi:hypothetical protein